LCNILTQLYTLCTYFTKFDNTFHNFTSFTKLYTIFYKLCSHNFTTLYKRAQRSTALYSTSHKVYKTLQHYTQLDKTLQQSTTLNNYKTLHNSTQLHNIMYIYTKLLNIYKTFKTYKIRHTCFTTLHNSTILYTILQISIQRSTQLYKTLQHCTGFHKNKTLQHIQNSQKTFRQIYTTLHNTRTQLYTTF